MTEGINCKKLYEELGRLKKLKVEFDRAYEEGLAIRDFGDCEPLYKEIKDLMFKPEGKLKKIVEFREFINTMNLKEQYESQLKVARKTGLFKGDAENQNALPVIERDGKEYMMPDWCEVKRKLFRNYEMVKEKADQGFSKMLIVPFASSLKDFESELRWNIRIIEDNGRGVFSADGDRVRFKKDEEDLYPLTICYKDDQLVYYPKKYDPKKHGGMTKDEVIDSRGAWQICFVEDLPLVPFLANKVIGGRVPIDKRGSGLKMNIGAKGKEPTIEDWHRAMCDKNEFADSESYEHEEGMVIEQYAWMQLTYLLEGEKPILLDYGDEEECGTYLLNSYNPSLQPTGEVPIPCWDWEVRRVIYAGDHPDLAFSTRYGVRPIITLQK